MKLIVGKNDLATTHPKLAEEADGWDPTTVIAGTDKRLQWKCSKGHIWIARAADRRVGYGCPFCSNQKVLAGYNDLATTNPDLAKEAHGWDPTTVFAGTNKKLQWKCSKGHTWTAVGKSRNAGTGCPVCQNKQVLAGYNDLATTNPDLAKQAHGWDPKKILAGTNKKLQWKCSKGHIWIAVCNDRRAGSGCPFCSNQKVLAGYNDLATTNPDLAKEAHGWDPTTVVAGTEKKLQWKCAEGHTWIVDGKSRSAGYGCPVCNSKQILVGYNDLATTHPDLAKQAHGWDPTTVFAGTDKKLQWKCSKGHIWIAASSQRTAGTGCPICHNKKFLLGYNDLATTNPDLAKQAHGWDPKEIITGTNKRLQWKCSKGHTWKARVADRGAGSGCPSCSTSGFDPNQNGYIYFLIQPTWEIFQIGITNNPEDRLQRHKRNGFQLLELRGPMDGHTAQELETALLRFLKSQKADLSPEHIAGKFDGYSESWTMDSYKVNNLKELIDKASEAGF